MNIRGGMRKSNVIVLSVEINDFESLFQLKLEEFINLKEKNLIRKQNN